MKTIAIGLALLAAALGVSAAPATAADFSYQGSLGNPNEVLQFDFTVAAASNVTLRTYSYAGGTNAAGTVIARGGFDPILTLFDSAGALIDSNDDGGLFVPADAVTGARFDTFLQELLAPGSYTVTVQAFANGAIGPNLANGFTGGGSFTDVTGDVRTSAWAFDILNVATAGQSTPGAVPEPSTWAMMLIGFGATGFALRRSRRQARLALA